MHLLNRGSAYLEISPESTLGVAALHFYNRAKEAPVSTEQPWKKYLADEEMQCQDEERTEDEEIPLAQTLAEQDVEQVLADETGQGLLWPRACHVQANILLTSALFRAQRSSRDIDALVAAQGGRSFALVGKTLTQFDELVWMDLLQLMLEQRKTAVRFSLRGIAKSLGISYSGQNLKRIKRSLVRMRSLTIVMMEDADTERAHPHRGYAGSLLVDFGWAGDRYAARLNPVWVRMLMREGYTRVDWERHTSLPVGFATWLHRYIHRHTATRKKPHRISIDRLSALLGTTMPLRNARLAIRKAMARIEQEGGVQGWEVDRRDNLVFWRKPSEKQRHDALMKKIGAQGPRPKTYRTTIKEQMPNHGQRSIFELAPASARFRPSKD